MMPDAWRAPVRPGDGARRGDQSSRPWLSRSSCSNSSSDPPSPGRVRDHRRRSPGRAARQLQAFHERRCGLQDGGAGTKLAAATAGSVVAFQADEHEARRRRTAGACWLQGRAEHVDDHDTGCPGACRRSGSESSGRSTGRPSTTSASRHGHDQRSPVSGTVSSNKHRGQADSASAYPPARDRPGDDRQPPVSPGGGAQECAASERSAS